MSSFAQLEYYSKADMPTGARKEEPIGDASAASKGKQTNGIAGPAAPAEADSQSLYAKQLAEVPELASYGPVLKSSARPIELTETETEYVVSVVKHVFKEHIVFQVRCFSLVRLQL